MSRRPVHKADSLTTFTCYCYEIWEPQVLEPSGPVQACTAIALSFLRGEGVQENGYLGLNNQGDSGLF